MTAGRAIGALVPDARRAGTIRIEVGGRLQWTVTEAVVAREGLEEGQAITEDLAARLEQAADQEAAVRTALRSLARRPFARQDLARRLVKKGHAASAVEPALEQIDTMGLLDDGAFAEEFVASKARRGQGPRRLLYDLRRLGVADDLANEAVARQFPPGGDLVTVISQLVAKRAGQLGKLPPAVKRRRLVAYLARRGYGGAEVRDAVEEAVT